jgi:hypothetical protein
MDRWSDGSIDGYSMVGAISEAGRVVVCHHAFVRKSTVEGEVQSRPIRRALVWLSFLWLASIASLIIWATATDTDPQDQAPKLVAAVGDSVSSAARQDPGPLDRLVTTNRPMSFGGADVFSVVPQVRGARPIWFSVTKDGAAVVGYQGTTLVEGVCVRSELSPVGVVPTQPHDCSAW